MSNRLTSFADAFTVPQLAQACMDELYILHVCDINGKFNINGKFDIHGKFIALKVLREVSKEICDTMLTHVKGYSHNLKLEGSDMQEALQPLRLLSRTKLSRLTIKIVDGRRGLRGKIGKMLLTEAELVKLGSQWAAFITGLGPALSTVTKISLTTHPEEPGENMEERELFNRSVSNLLAMVAPACPALTKLQVHGLVHEDALQTFGSTCLYLNRLDLEAIGPHFEILQQLSLLLPNLHTLHFNNPDRHSKKQNQAEVSVVLPFLSSCMNITHLKLGGNVGIKKAMWTQFPPTLKILSSDKDGRGDGPPTHLQLPCLEKIEWRSNLQGIRALLLAAPNLNFMLMARVEIDMEDPNLLTSWDMLSARVCAGMSGPSFVKLYNDEVISCAAFLSAAQPMPGMTLVNLEGSDVACADDVDCLKHLAQVFPEINYLILTGLDINDASFHDLLPCRCLRKLELTACKHISEHGVGMIAQRVPTLEHIVFWNCVKIDNAAVEHLGQLFLIYGLQVTFSMKI